MTCRAARASSGDGSTRAGLGSVDAVQGLSEIANNVTFAGEKLVAALAAQLMTPGPFVRSLLRRRLARRLLGGTLARHGGQAGQFSAAGSRYGQPMQLAS